MLKGQPQVVIRRGDDMQRINGDMQSAFKKVSTFFFYSYFFDYSPPFFVDATSFSSQKRRERKDTDEVGKKELFGGKNVLFVFFYIKAC